MLMPARPRRSGAFDRIVILGFVIAGSALVLRPGLRPRDPLAGAAVVFAPWTSAADALGRATAAGASIVRIGAIPSIVIVSPGRRIRRPRARRRRAPRSRSPGARRLRPRPPFSRAQPMT